MTALITFSQELYSTCIKTEQKHYPLTLPNIDCLVDEEAAKTISQKKLVKSQKLEEKNEPTFNTAVLHNTNTVKSVVLLISRHDIKSLLILCQLIHGLPAVLCSGTWLLSRQESFLKQEMLANLQPNQLITLSEKDSIFNTQVVKCYYVTNIRNRRQDIYS